MVAMLTFGSVIFFDRFESTFWFLHFMTNTLNDTFEGPQKQKNLSLLT
jgi:hypothetical protein